MEDEKIDEKIVSDNEKISNKGISNSLDNNSLARKDYLNNLDNKNIELTPIKLNSNTKNIKSEDDENLNTKSYAIYGLFGFCILLAFLFAFKKIRNKKYKNEFE